MKTLLQFLVLILISQWVLGQGWNQGYYQQQQQQQYIQQQNQRIYQQQQQNQQMTRDQTLQNQRIRETTYQNQQKTNSTYKDYNSYKSNNSGSYGNYNSSSYSSSKPVDIENYEDGLADEKKGLDNDAIEAYTKSIKANAEFKDSYKHRAAIYLKQKKYQLALADYDKIVSLEVKNNNQEDLLKAYENRAEANFQLENYASAVSDLNRILLVHTSDNSLLYRRAYSFMKLKDYKNALADIQKMESAQGYTFDSYLLSAEIYQSQGNFTEAVDHYKNAISVNKSAIKPYYSLSALLSKMGDYKQAVEYYTRLLAADPQQADGYYNRAVTFSKTGQVQQANADFGQALQLNENTTVLMYLNGLLYFSEGNLSEAYKELNAALKETGCFFPELVYMAEGDVFSRQNNFLDARNAYQKALEIDSSMARAYTCLGFVEMSLKNYPVAMQRFYRATLLNESDSEPMLGLALSKYYSGDLNGCKDLLKLIPLNTVNKETQPRLTPASTGSLWISDHYADIKAMYARLDHP
ncbi:MAG: tetratricopeptide repeat protein [Bacteroidetes bacterium]|nr:tetratricopeptide repeat protein [Bacteroidota bacterium]